MKILVFNGSPKKEKSDTMHITRAFLAGMNELAPQEVQTVEVADRSIAFCRGCFACKYNGGHCRIDDDMGEILKQMLASDLLLFSFPLYCYGMPAMLKNLIDRTLPLSSMPAPEAAAVTGPRLELIRRAGRQYAETGGIDGALLAEIGAPMIPEELYAQIVNQGTKA